MFNLGVWFGWRRSAKLLQALFAPLLSWPHHVGPTQHWGDDRSALFSVKARTWFGLVPTQEYG
jgi:hypothetical protein